MCNFPRDDTYNAYENLCTVGQLWIGPFSSEFYRGKVGLLSKWENTREAALSFRLEPRIIRSP